MRKHGRICTTLYILPLLIVFWWGSKIYSYWILCLFQIFFFFKFLGLLTLTYPKPQPFKLYLPLFRLSGPAILAEWTTGHMTKCLATPRARGRHLTQTGSHMFSLSGIGDWDPGSLLTVEFERFWTLILKYSTHTPNPHLRSLRVFHGVPKVQTIFMIMLSDYLPFLLGFLLMA